MLAVLVTVFAFYLLHRFTEGITLGQVVADIRATPNSHVLYAILATALSFCAVATYEILAVRVAAPGRVSYLTAAWTGVAGFAVSNAVGFHVLTGGALRYRIYSQKGLDLAVIGQIVFLAWSSLWIAMVFLVGFALAYDPNGLAELSQLAPEPLRGIGIAMLALIVVYFIWSARGGRTITARGVTVNVPGPGISLMQLGAGIVDIGASAFTLYILLPADAAGALSGFFVVFISAIILGALSHTPGGLGVFEATLMAGLGVLGRSDVVGALVLYRVIYYLLPLVPVAITLIYLEGVRGNLGFRKSIRDIGKASEPLVPPLAAGLTFVGGLILLFSGSLPASALRQQWVQSVLSLPFVESSHLAASLVGVALLVVAHALLRRRQSGFNMALALLAAGAVLSLLKGLDYEEALILGAIALLLIPFRPAFYRKSGLPVFSITPGWLVVVCVTVAAAVWLGFFAYRHVEYSNQLWWQFTWDGDAPRFLRTSVAVVAVVFALGLHMILNRRATTPAQAGPVPDSVRKLVAESSDVDATIALLGDKQFLIAEDDSAFLMYGIAGGSYIAKGDPIGDPDQGRALAWRFRELADEGGYRTVFYSIGQDNLPLYLDMGLSVLKIGEVAWVDLSKFSLDTPQQKDFRYARRRAGKDGLEFAIVGRDEVPSILPACRQVSDAWLGIKSGTEKHFALGNFNDDYLKNFDFAVVRKEGEIVAFANILAGAGKQEISIDLMRHRPKVSNVLMDFLFAELLLQAQADGYHWFNLGAAPLAGLSDHPLATSWNRIGTMIYQRGEDFYHFEGLRSYKEKFSPVWRPNYVACPGGLAVPRVLIDITSLISGGALGLARK